MIQYSEGLKRFGVTKYFVMNWSKNDVNCISCGTIEWSHKAKGYCQKCYPLIKDIKRVKAWNENKPETLCMVRGVNPYILKHEKRINDLRVVKKRMIEQMQNRIKLLKRYTNPKEVDGLGIEYAFEAVARYCAVGSRLYYGIASKYLDNFNDKQRRIIYKDLLKIEVNRKFNLNISYILFP